MPRFLWAAFTALAVVACATACGGGDPAPDLQITNAYVTSTGSDVAALYFTVVNHGGADTLLSVQTDAAAQSMFHQDVVSGNSSSMQARENIPIPANGQFAFKPGDFHVMLMNPPTPLTEGSSITVTAVFKRAGAKLFSAPVVKPGEEP
jgi:copper(I)-binding protein